jgi:hypothetical protein
MNLIIRKPKRIFTFGCSFTNYAWSMWPEIISYDLEIPLYNYGRTGAGNQFIANTICQANAKYKFNSNDLVMVCWTNVCREDRWANGGWILPGNIFTQNEYDSKWVEKFIDPLGLLMRDLASINLINNLLKTTNCQYHFLSMMNIVNGGNQWNSKKSKFNSFEKLNPETGKNIDVLDELLEYYKNDIDQIQKSFYEVLWDDDIEKKLDIEWRRFNGNFHDGHPWPTESLEYLKSVFVNHKFKQSTVDKVFDVENKIINEINNYFLNNKVKHRPLPIWGFEEKIFDKIISDYAIVKYPLPFIL